MVNDTGLGEHASKKSKSVHGFVTGNWMAVIILQSLLDEPNPNSPANSLAAQLYQENKREYEKKVIAIVEQSWLNNWWPRYRGKLKRTLLICASFFSLSTPVVYFSFLCLATRVECPEQCLEVPTVILLTQLLCGKISQRCYWYNVLV